MPRTLKEMRAQDPFLSGTASPAASHAIARAGRGELVLLGVQAASLLAMAATVATRVWQEHLWFGFVLVGLTLAVWIPEVRQRRERTLWFIYVAGIFVYTLLRALADETWIPIRTDYVIHLDNWLPGPTPVQWLQEWRVDVGIPEVLDYLAIAVHWSFFIAPHAGVVAAFTFRRAAFQQYVALFVGTMWLGLTLFFLLPTSPPWLAGESGDLPGVTRIMDATLRDAFADGTDGGAATYDEFYKALGEPNSVAAMPSIHMGITFAMYLWARRHAKRFALPLLAYSALMALALLYLGEHYVADELAGVACAVAVWAAVQRFVPLKAVPGEAQAARR